MDPKSKCKSRSWSRYFIRTIIVVSRAAPTTNYLVYAI